MILSVALVLIGIIIGYFMTKWSITLDNKISKNKLILDKNKQFKQILEKVNTKRSRFKTRINNTVYIGVKLQDYGRVDIVYFLDKNNNKINIFKEDKLIITSDLVDEDLLNKIIISINKTHYHKINDIVEILGLVFYREDFERSFGVNIQELKQRYMSSMSEEQSDIDKIINNNKYQLDIDDILDRINKVGIENLTKEEKDFLNNYNK